MSTSTDTNFPTIYVDFMLMYVGAASTDVSVEVIRVGLGDGNFRCMGGAYLAERGIWTGVRRDGGTCRMGSASNDHFLRTFLSHPSFYLPSFNPISGFKNMECGYEKWNVTSTPC